MQEISENALMMSVQAVQYAIQHLSAERDAVSGSEQADYDQIIESYEIVAAELRGVYQTAHAQGLDLPAYQDLVG